ncbi:MAG: hypothetical protein IKC21_00785 [Ruminococcus sp.]|nr:hypothetical protein [Ruminococcus sp.]
MTNIIYCVDKPCNTQSITAVCRLVTDVCHVRNFTRVPFFREPLIKFQYANRTGRNALCGIAITIRWWRKLEN